jgi:hypothetical protein
MLSETSIRASYAPKDSGSFEADAAPPPIPPMKDSVAMAIRKSVDVRKSKNKKGLSSHADNDDEDEAPEHTCNII